METPEKLKPAEEKVDSFLDKLKANPFTSVIVVVALISIIGVLVLVLK